MRCAVVFASNNIIENVIVADPAVDAIPDGRMLAWAPDTVNPGDAWNNGAFLSTTAVSTAATSTTG